MQSERALFTNTCGAIWLSNLTSDQINGATWVSAAPGQCHFFDARGSLGIFDTIGARLLPRTHGTLRLATAERAVVVDALRILDCRRD
jgi:hypothetical protein